MHVTEYDDEPRLNGKKKKIITLALIDTTCKRYTGGDYGEDADARSLKDYLFLMYFFRLYVESF